MTRVMLLLALLAVGCAKEHTNRVRRFAVANGVYRGTLTLYHPARVSTDSLSIWLVGEGGNMVYLRDLALPTEVESLTATEVWLKCRYDDCDLYLRTYPGRIGVGASFDSLRGYSTMTMRDSTYGHPGTWRAER